MPPGDADKGRQAFVALDCHTCHRVAGVDLPAPEKEGPVQVLLGGEVLRVRSYGDLVTAIIHPSEGLASGYPKDVLAEGGQSRMPDYGDRMTVSQLIDLVTFLHGHYSRLEPEYAPYML